MQNVKAIYFVGDDNLENTSENHSEEIIGRKLHNIRQIMVKEFGISEINAACLIFYSGLTEKDMNTLYCNQDEFESAKELLLNSSFAHVVEDQQKKNGNI